MEDILSPRASLVSFSVIRVDYGAKDQDWHSDAGLLKTPFGYENPYAFDTYSLAIPLQDINVRYISGAVHVSVANSYAVFTPLIAVQDGPDAVVSGCPGD